MSKQQTKTDKTIPISDSVKYIKIPSNMTEKETYDIIYKVCDVMQHNRAFDMFGQDDLYQVIFIMCIDALERYDEGLPLENFLFTHCRRRLINFHRDNDPKLTVINDADASQHLDIPEHDNTLELHIQDVVDRLLTPVMRVDYMKIKNGVRIPHKRLVKVRARIKEIIDDYYSDLRGE